MAHRMAGRGPARRDDCRGGATARMLRHNGSACGFSGLSEMAASPLQRPGRRWWRLLSARPAPLSWHAICRR